MKKLTLTQRLHLIAKKMFSGDFSTPMFSPLYEEVNGMSVVHINGEIGKKLSKAELMEGKVDVDHIVGALKIAAKANTECVVLCVNSPGGSSVGVEETGAAIKKLSESKPVFTFTDTICASAAYWMASCTNGIFCTPSSELGSIGVFAKVMDFSENLKMQGINCQIFSAGAMKTMGAGEKPLTDEESAYIQKDIDEQWIKFKTLVRENRGDVAEETMQGQLFAGEKAVEANLADEVVLDFDTFLKKIGGNQQ